VTEISLREALPQSLPFQTGRATSHPESREMRSSAKDSLDLATVTDLAGFQALESDWNALFERSGSSHQFFQTFNWLWHWCRVYLPDPDGDGGCRLSIVTGRQNGRLVLCWPLVIERKLGLRCLEWMGLPVSQYGDVLLDDDPASGDWLEESWRYVRRELGADLISLASVRRDGAVAPVTQRYPDAVVRRRLALARDLSHLADCETFEQGLSSRGRANRRRQRRRLAEMGEITFTIHREGEEALAVTDRALALKRLWLRSRGLLSKAFMDRRFDVFFASVAGAGERATGCHVSDLSVGGRLAAAEVGFRCKGRHYGHVLAYDNAFVRFAPGTLQIEGTMRDCVDQGQICFDLQAPADAYKRNWADTECEVSDYAIALSVAGSIFNRCISRGLFPLAKWTLTRLPRPVRQRLARIALSGDARVGR